MLVFLLALLFSIHPSVGIGATFSPMDSIGGPQMQATAAIAGSQAQPADSIGGPQMRPDEDSIGGPQ